MTPAAQAPTLDKSLRTASAPQPWPVVGIVAAGLVLMLCAPFILRSPFFQIARESEPAGAARGRQV